MKHNWEYKRLGDLCNISSSRRVLQSDWKESGVPFYRAREIVKLSENGFVNNELFISENLYDELAKSGIPQAGDIMLSAVGTLGATYIVKPTDKFYYKDASVICLSKISDLQPKFLCYLFDSNIILHQIDRQAKGATVGTITISNASKFKVPVPDYKVQEQIVAELDKINETIEDCRELLRNLDALAQSLFYDTFGDPILNQKGWETNTIEQICISIVRGPFGGALKKEIFVPKSHNTYKVYEQKHAIQKNAQIGTYYICENDFKRLKRFELIPGDIIMSCSGTIGEFFKLPLTAEAGVMNQALLKFSLSDKVDSIYFLFLMKDMKRLFTIYGTGLQNISSVTTVKHVSIPVPPLELQKKFAERIEQIEAQKKAVEETIENLQTLLDSRMDYWFN